MPAKAGKWQVRLSESKLKDVRQLLEKHEALRDTFDRLLLYVGLWTCVELGALHRILPQGCPEVCESLMLLNRLTV